VKTKSNSLTAVSVAHLKVKVAKLLLDVEYIAQEFIEIPSNQFG
jgi:hypothetical protein